MRREAKKKGEGVRGRRRKGRESPSFFFPSFSSLPSRLPPSLLLNTLSLDTRMQLLTLALTFLFSLSGREKRRNE